MVLGRGRGGRNLYEISIKQCVRFLLPGPVSRSGDLFVAGEWLFVPERSQRQGGSATCMNACVSAGIQSAHLCDLCGSCSSDTL